MDGERFGWLLGYLVTHLDNDLRADTIANAAGLSTAHCQREIHRLAGQPLGKLIERLRMHRAARHLVLHDDRVIDIGLRCGYQNHETFCRAFSRFYGTSPSAYRTLLSPPHIRSAHATSREAMQVSTPRQCRLRALPYIARRHLGPYENVPDTLWHELDAQSRAAGLAIHLPFGIGWDAPDVVPAAQLRFDAAYTVRDRQNAREGGPLQMLPAGNFAVVVHTGHYDTLPLAYAATVEQLRSSGLRLAPGPSLEFYLTERMNTRVPLQFTEIYLPLA